MTSSAGPRPPLLTADDIARELQCAPATAYRLIRFMKSTKLGRLVRVKRADFEAYLERHAIDAAGPPAASSPRAKPATAPTSATRGSSATKPASKAGDAQRPSGIPAIRITLPRTKPRAPGQLPR